MRYFLLLVAVLWIGSRYNTPRAQTYCGTLRNTAFAVRPELNTVTGSGAAGKATGIRHIPVVVHVIYQNSVQNYADAVVRNILEEVNNGLRKRTIPVFTPRPIFDSLWADMELEVCLASVDPSGRPTSGITHTQTGMFFVSNGIENIKHASTGGVDAWPVGSYLNIWIAPVSGGVAGNAVNNNVFSAPGATEGLIINSGYTDFMVNNVIHELGHFIGLHHTFDNAAELVDDTPFEGTGGHTFINSMASTCAPGNLDSNTSATESPYWGTTNPVDMVENFMGYNRPCQFMFTKGQKARAAAMIQTYYSTLATTGCGTPSAVTFVPPHANFLVRNTGSGIFLYTDIPQPDKKFYVYDAAGIKRQEGSLRAGSWLELDKLSGGLYLITYAGLVKKVVIPY